MAAPYRSGDGQGQADCQTCKRGCGLRTIRANRRPRKQADMQSRRQAGDHAASDARGHRQDGPRFAGQATRGKPDPAGHPQRGKPGTGSPADADDRAEPPRSRGQFQRVWQRQRGAIQPRRLARKGSGRRDALPDPAQQAPDWGRRRRGAMPPERPHANLGSAAGGGEFA